MWLALRGHFFSGRHMAVTGSYGGAVSSEGSRSGAARLNGWMRIGSRRYQAEEVVENMKGAVVSLHLQQIHAPVPRDRPIALAGTSSKGSQITEI